jgi:hypothetical protein
MANQTIGFIFYSGALALFYIVPVLIVNGLIYLIFRFKFKLTDWYVYDLIIMIVPGMLHSVSFLFDIHFGRPQCMPTFFIKLYILIISNIIVFLIRTVMCLKKPENSKKYSVLGMVFYFLLALVITIFFPNLNFQY